MSEPSEWDKTLSALNPPPPGSVPAVLLPVKAPLPSGKRNRLGWKQKSVLLIEERVQTANERLNERGDGTDYSDLMQALLDPWLNSSE